MSPEELTQIRHVVETQFRLQLYKDAKFPFKGNSITLSGFFNPTGAWNKPNTSNTLGVVFP